MARPQCPQHPNGRVWKHGRYGKDQQYQRWRCIPAGVASPHTFSRVLPRKQVGGKSRECLECGRDWEDGEGMASAVRDRYTLRDKAVTLLKLAEGHSYRDASQQARVRADEWTKGENGSRIFSRDGRLAGDWVSQYAEVVTEPDLPDEWPATALVIDHITLKRLDTDEEGQPKQGGKVAFHVFGAMGYQDDTGADQGERPRKPELYALGAYKWLGNEAWADFFDRLDGRPSYVVCDAHKGLRKALRERWPNVPVYPCVYHLYRTVLRHVRTLNLGDTRLGKRLSKKFFYRQKPFDALCYLLDQLHQEEWSRLTAKQRNGVKKIDGVVNRSRAGIQRRINEPRYPLSTGALERLLRRVKRYLYDRRNVLRNMVRLNDLLALMAVQQRTPADIREWARRLRDEHRSRNGTPLPRRLVDDPDLDPRKQG